METPLFTKKTLANIRVWLTEENKKTLASNYHVKEGTVRNILYGCQPNEDLLKEAMAMAVENKIEAEKHKEILNAPTR